ncbi:MAG: hypothetical protein IJ578_06680 [Bacteroidales bacterium]|nr:hypothetical protein [Bacteroidales bacterium]
MNRCLTFLAMGLLAACSRGGMQDGDLIFQANDSNGFTDAIEQVTDGAWSHVGIIQTDRTGTYVLEATTQAGVARTPLTDFLASSAQDASGRPVVRVCRLTGPGAARIGRRAVRQAETYLGRPYDYAFAEGMESVYCSELVWQCFRREDGSPVFTARPMTFKGPDGETDPYWTEHYARLGVPVPEGTPGTNPNDLSRDPVLQEISVVFPVRKDE